MSKDNIYGFDLVTNDDIELTEIEKEELEHRKSPGYHFNIYANRGCNLYTRSNRLEVLIGDIFDYRYEVCNRLGKGTFGNVYLCKDHKYNQRNVAVKVIRHEKRFRKFAKIEIALYDFLNVCPNYSNNVIRMLKSFEFRNNVFLVFETHGKDLYYYYKNYNITDKEFKSFAKQIASGLEFIHENDIIHADLKPENILVKNNHLKIIDLGSALTEEQELHKDYIQSRYYRSPDVVFKLKTTRKIDIWSYGCILYELTMKTPLVYAKSTRDLVIYFAHIMGYPPIDLDCYYDNSEFFVRHSKELVSFRTVKGKFLYPNDFKWQCDNIMLKQLVMGCCIKWDMNERLTASKILEHPFFIEP